MSLISMIFTATVIKGPTELTVGDCEKRTVTEYRSETYGHTKGAQSLVGNKIHCPKNSFLQGWDMLPREDKKIQFEFSCITLNTVHDICYEEHSTAYIQNLKLSSSLNKQHPKCATGYGLNSFGLINDNGSISIKYKCCEILHGSTIVTDRSEAVVLEEDDLHGLSKLEDLRVSQDSVLVGYILHLEKLEDGKVKAYYDLESTQLKVSCEDASSQIEEEKKNRIRKVKRYNDAKDNSETVKEENKEIEKAEEEDEKAKNEAEENNKEEEEKAKEEGREANTTDVIKEKATEDEKENNGENKEETEAERIQREKDEEEKQKKEEEAKIKAEEERKAKEAEEELKRQQEAEEKAKDEKAKKEAEEHAKKAEENAATAEEYAKKTKTHADNTDNAAKDAEKARDVSDKALKTANDTKSSEEAAKALEEAKKATKAAKEALKKAGEEEKLSRESADKVANAKTDAQQNADIAKRAVNETEEAKESAKKAEEAAKKAEDSSKQAEKDDDRSDEAHTRARDAVSDSEANEAAIQQRIASLKEEEEKRRAAEAAALKKAQEAEVKAEQGAANATSASVEADKVNTDAQAHIKIAEEADKAIVKADELAKKEKVKYADDAKDLAEKSKKQVRDAVKKLKELLDAAKEDAKNALDAKVEAEKQADIAEDQVEITEKAKEPAKNADKSAKEAAKQADEAQDVVDNLLEELNRVIKIKNRVEATAEGVINLAHSTQLNHYKKLREAEEARAKKLAEEAAKEAEEDAGNASKAKKAADNLLKAANDALARVKKNLANTVGSKQLAESHTTADQAIKVATDSLTATKAEEKNTLGLRDSTAKSNKEGKSASNDAKDQATIAKQQFDITDLAEAASKRAAKAATDASNDSDATLEVLKKVQQVCDEIAKLRAEQEGKKKEIVIRANAVKEAWRLAEIKRKEENAKQLRIMNAELTNANNARSSATNQLTYTTNQYNSAVAYSNNSNNDLNRTNGHSNNALHRRNEANNSANAAYNERRGAEAHNYHHGKGACTRARNHANYARDRANHARNEANAAVHDFNTYFANQRELNNRVNAAYSNFKSAEKYANETTNCYNRANAALGKIRGSVEKQQGQAILNNIRSQMNIAHQKKNSALGLYNTAVGKRNACNNNAVHVTNHRNNANRYADEANGQANRANNEANYCWTVANNKERTALTQKYNCFNGWNSAGGGDIFYLDRQSVDCKSCCGNSFLQRFKMKRSGGSIAYEFRCRHVIDSKIGSCYYRETSWNKYRHWHHKKSAHYLDRHHMRCNQGSALQYFRLQRLDRWGWDKVRYRYRCCHYPLTNQATGYTGLTSNGNKSTYYLDRQDVNLGWNNNVLTGIRLETHGSNFRYQYQYSTCRD